MNLALASGVLLLIAISAPASAQQPPAGAAPAPKPTPVTKPLDLDSCLQRLLVAPDTLSMAQVVEAVSKAGADGRARVRALLERVSPAAAALPPVDATAKPDPKAMNEPLAADTKAIVEDLLGKDTAKADAAAKTLTESVAAAPEQVRKVVARSQAIVASCIQRAFREQDESGAIFAGQHTPLGEFGPLALETLSTWMVKPPTGGAGLRVKCIQAVRDLVVGKPDDKLVKALKDIATGGSEPSVQVAAKYALAQFGDRSFIDPQIQKLQERAKADQVVARSDALDELADIYYQLREYKAAADAHKQHLALIEDGKIDRKTVRNLPTQYYNACCSMALAGMTDDAFAFLEKAIVESAKSPQPLNRKLIQVDMDIESLRQDPRFPKVLALFDAKK